MCDRLWDTGHHRQHWLGPVQHLDLRLLVYTEHHRPFRRIEIQPHHVTEFGPRALGNRSIYADPRPRENQERVNKVVKSRESFRPFAPVVIASAAEEYFDLDHPVHSYRFMTLVGRSSTSTRTFCGR